MVKNDINLELMNGNVKKIVQNVQYRNKNDTKNNYQYFF